MFKQLNIIFFAVLLALQPALGASTYLQSNTWKSADLSKTWTPPASTSTLLGAGLGSIVNADINASAGITYGKLSLTGSLLNADISSSAAIGWSKMADLTVNRALVSNASGDVTVSSVTDTQIGYLSTTTGDVQVALDAKTLKSTLTAKGSTYVATAASTVAQQAAGNDGEVLVYQASATNGLAPAPLSGRNKIHNGAMIIDQRLEGAAYTLGTANPTLDRWLTQKLNTSATGTVQQVGTVPTGFPHSLKVTLTGIDSALGSTDQINIYQVIEGSNLSNLDFGLATAKSVTLSFWVRSSLTGTYCVNFTNLTRGYIAEYTISVADTWEKKTITIAGDTSGTWPITEGTAGMYIYWSLMNGSASQGSAGSWLAATKMSTSNQVNWAANASATFYLTGVQLEKGNVTTDFEWDDPSILLTKVQRFYQKTYAKGTAAGAASFSGTVTGFGANEASTTNMFGSFQFVPPMYAAPTVAVYAAGTGTASKVARAVDGVDTCTGMGAGDITTKGFRYIGGSSCTAGARGMFQYTADTGK